MSLPVPGGILAQMAPAASAMDPRALMALAALKNAGQPDTTPGAAVAPAAVAPPTVAANAQAPAPVSLTAEPIANTGPTMAEAMAGMPQGDIHHGFLGGHTGILGSIGDKLADPNFRAEALRFGMGAFNGGAGGGLKAATDFADQRRAAAEDARRFDAGQALRERGLANDETNTAITGKHYDRSDDNQRYGILANYDLGREGHQVEERNSIRSNTTSRLNNREDNTTSRANTHETVGASILNNNNDNTTAQTIATGKNATDLGVATINSGQKGRLKPDDALTGLAGILPGMLGTNDSKGVGDALAATPDLQAQLVDAYTNAWGDGSGNAAERAQKAVASVLGNGASYTDDNSWLPFHGSPEITRGQAQPSVGGGQQQQPSAAPAAPKPGDRVDGYTFKGGDPADQKNWTK